MKDPLAGRRQEINEGTAYSLMWPDDGDGCPVKVDEHFNLRSCRIQISRVHRVQKNGNWFWRAEFARFVPERLWLLKPATGGGSDAYTEKPEEARKADEDSEEAETLYSVQPLENPLNLHAPPEPESVPPHEIANYSGSRRARQLHEREMAEQRVREVDAPLEQRLARLREQARERHVDVSSEERVIERRIAAMEAKVLERSGAAA